MPARIESSVSRPGSPERLRRAAGWKRRALKSAGARCMARCTARCVACLVLGLGSGLGSVVGVTVSGQGWGQWSRSGSVVRARVSGQDQGRGALRRLLASHLEVAYGGEQRRVAREALHDTVPLELLAAEAAVEAV